MELHNNKEETINLIKQRLSFVLKQWKDLVTLTDSGSRGSIFHQTEIVGTLIRVQWGKVGKVSQK